MKKLLLVLTVVAMASFLFVGCLGTGTQVDNGDDTVVTATVEVGDSVVLNGKTYVSGGDHEVKVTFTTAVAGNVSVVITACSGDYSAYKSFPEAALVNVIMFPDADRKIWTGSGTFYEYNDCCASLIQVLAGECIADICIEFPIIVDSEGPYAQIQAETIACPCDTGDQLKLTSTWTGTTEECVTTPGGCCDDYCSGLASWTLDIYDEDPFDVCCAPDPCVTAYKSCIGTACPVECLTECDEDFFAAGDPELTKDYYVIVSMTDKVANETKYYGILVVDTDSIVYFNDSIFDPITCEWGTVDSLATLGLAICPTE